MIQIKPSPNEISRMIEQFNLDIQPIINQLVIINNFHIPTYILHQDGRMEIKNNYTIEQEQQIEYLRELIYIKQDELKEKIQCYQKCYP